MARWGRLKRVVCSAPLVFAVTGCRAERPPEGAAKAFVGSAACAECHQDIYDRWQGTLMANVIQDPAEHPEVVLGDFATPNPLVTFTLEDVAFTYGSKWKQRYFTQIGNDFYVFPAQWDVENAVWRRYGPQPGTDWWTEHYPNDQMQRPTGPLCDGCHSVNYDVATKSVTEWNVGCEKCHGAGSLHVEFPVAETIENASWPDDHVRADDVCLQCHTQGQPLTNPIEGQYYDWPVGYQPGDRLADFWALDEHHLGENTFTHWPEGSAHKNRMQGNDYVQSLMYARGVTCAACHDVHGTENEADLKLPGNAVCTECHSPQLQAGPRGTLAYHTQHEEDSEGSQCVACHMPRIAPTVGDVSVRSHTFRFLTPALAERYGMPDPCTSCHTDRSAEWATEELKDWPDVSPWRVQD
ncbi:MAG: cytochrome C [Gemmatimonadetes bacterium]|nr:cytochrome C [Gemmatimonadota bacterium]